MPAPPTSDWSRPFGATGLTVTAVTAGGASLGSMPEIFGYEVSERDAVKLVQDVLASPIRALDTANGYSAGRSEERIGLGIDRFGGLPDDFLVMTKVDADGRDYSGERVRSSLRESRSRLGIDNLPMVYLHDPEFHDFEMMTAPGGAVDALVAARAAGEVGHIGVAGGDVHEMARYLALGVFDAVLIHNRWTLVDRSATELIAQASGQGIAVINAAIYGGGILASRSGESRSYGYRPATERTLAAIRDLHSLCDRWDTDLATAALQGSLRDNRVASTVVGFSKPSRLQTILTSAAVRLPDDFWEEAETLVPPRENWLDFQP
jgi:D-threo-aldose 1-dehydrogenase